jgi:hypothetical protein
MPTNNLPTKNDVPAGGLSSAGKDAGRLSEYDIVANDIKKYKLGISPKKAYAALIQMSQQPNYRIIRANNSLLFIDNNGDGTAEGIMFSSDKPQAFVASLRQFNKALRVGGFHKLEIMSVKTDIEPFLKKAGLNYSITPVDSGIQITVTE